MIKNKGFRYILVVIDIYILVVIDNCSKFGWTIPLKIKISQTIKNSSGISFTTLKRMPFVIYINDGKEF